MSVNLTILSLSKETINVFTKDGYSIFLGLLGLFITILGGIIWGESKNECETDSSYIGITIIGILIIVGSGINKMI